MKKLLIFFLITLSAFALMAKSLTYDDITIAILESAKQNLAQNDSLFIQATDFEQNFLLSLNNCFLNSNFSILTEPNGNCKILKLSLGNPEAGFSYNPFSSNQKILMNLELFENQSFKLLKVSQLTFSVPNSMLSKQYSKKPWYESFVISGLFAGLIYIIYYSNQ